MLFWAADPAAFTISSDWCWS